MRGIDILQEIEIWSSREVVDWTLCENSGFSTHNSTSSILFDNNLLIVLFSVYRS